MSPSLSVILDYADPSEVSTKGDGKNLKRVARPVKWNFEFAQLVSEVKFRKLVSTTNDVLQKTLFIKVCQVL